ncbi:hypothetical protein LAWI1_G007051 [Lachnellula willkommii]|uniref:Microsomal glutathione S-transferase n=1 Tax=Lachnellula willkommii TaxID=215461 RepID=A0A559LZH8_9HELO|nr:hypothetical protein LAWI1_G007051 [Lachnellula willkommii]
MASTTFTPKLLPITGTWAAPFALYSSILSSRIVASRIKTEKFIGEKSTSINGVDPLQTAVRCQGNFLENVPLAFIFLALCELNGGNRKYLNYVMGAFLALRVAHVEGGLMLQGSFGTNGVGRPVGYFGSVGVVTGLAAYAAYLAKGYWGF